MYLFTLILGLVLFPQAHALNCFSCENSSAGCSKKLQCPNESDQCGALRTINYHGNSKALDIASRSCLSPQLCFKGSLNFGVERVVVTTDCCTSDSCNKNNPAEPKTKPNKKKCYRCDGKSDCTGTLNCDGDEDRCVKATVTKDGKAETVKGCATKSMCSDYDKVNITGLSTLVCCEGDLCNGAEGSSTSFLLLTTMLISICLFSN